MALESTICPFPEPPPADGGEFSGRLLLACALLALCFGLSVLWFSYEAQSGTRSGQLGFALCARLGTYALAGFIAHLLQGSRCRTRSFFIVALLSGMLLFW